MHPKFCAGLLRYGLWAAAALWLGGCAQLDYLAQSAGGHLQLLNQTRPVQTWIDDDRQPAALRERLALAQRMRDFAVAELGLPDNSSYRSYTDLRRPFAVWNVAAAPELSLSLRTWCFPIVGCVAYRGYYERAQADAFAQSLQGPGLEVAVYGVPAYSTLGWTDWLGGDPLLSSFIGYPEGELARMLFHELAHQVAYASDDTLFNESFATAVEGLGARRWLARFGTPGARDEYAGLERRRREFRTLAEGWRTRLDALYRSPASVDDKRRVKAELMVAFKADYAALKARAWGGYAGYDGWMARVNNASLGMLAAYNELTPQFEALFEFEGRDFARFYAAVRVLTRLPKEERHATLRAYLPHHAMETH